MENRYDGFLKSKQFKIEPSGFDVSHADIHPMLFPFQKDIVKWAVKRGRCAVFLDTGLGKTFIQLEWARIINKRTLIFAPLSVARQTIREGKKINIDVHYVRDESEMVDGINIANYEILDHFSSGCADAIVLDESSILKSLSGVTRKKITKTFSGAPFKMCCTATPAPNDFTEIGNHAEFLNVCSMQEMLAMFFINRREWRFGQKKPVQVWIILSEQEREIYENILRKDGQAKRLKIKMIEQLRDFEKNGIQEVHLEKDEYKEATVKKDEWTAMLGDSCRRMAEIGDGSIDMSVYSPPFADLFVYSNSLHDLGNCRNWDKFFEHYKFIVSELLRVTKPGRLSCVHTSDIPAMANRDGYIGLKDFPGRVINLHIESGWTFVGRAFVQKNPQAQAIRVKSKSLLFVQLNKDSSHSRPALVDQILIFKKPGENAVPITPVENGELDNNTWISWAHGIWTDISETNTLQFYHAREKLDEKHICPLQLGTIERCVKLYSNPGETVFTPFMGIGSEAFVAVNNGRRAIGIELKESYFNVAVSNLNSAVIQKSIFS